MNYTVQLIADDALPPEQVWAVVQTDDGTIAFIKRSGYTPRVLANVWAACRVLRLANEPRPTPLTLAG